MRRNLNLPLPIRFNLFLATIALLSGLGTAVLLIYEDAVRDYQTLQRQGLILARLIARNAEYPLYVNDRTPVQRLLNTFTDFPGLLYVQIEDTHCRVWLRRTYQTPIFQPHRTTCPPVNNPAKPQWRWLWDPRGRILDLAVPITTPEPSGESGLFFDENGKRKRLGYVLTGFDLTDFRQAIIVAGLQSLGITLLLLLPILWFSWKRSRRLTRPLERLHRALEQLTRGHHAPLEVSAPIPELRLLEEKFNTVLQRLDDYQQHLEWLAFQDTLTGLANRTWLQVNLPEMVRETQRRNRSLALLFLDLDHFKIVNDTLGHETGDRLLLAVAEILKQTVRTEDPIIRLGGDEFLIILTHLSRNRTQATAQATKVAKKIVTALNLPLTIAGHELSATFSIGIALCPHDASDPETLLRYADTAMYAAKGAGRNTFRLFQPEQSDPGRRRLGLETALRRAVKRRQLTFHIQPQILYPEGLVIGAEVLLRWHWNRQWISPGEFIPLLEETGLIVPVGEWLISEVLQLKRHWYHQNLCGPRFRHLAVNISPVQLWRSDFAKQLLNLLNAYADDVPISLELELTESDLIQPTPTILDTFGRLRDAGLRFAIDDFGTGYSNLAYLKRFPLDTIKIDQSFVRGCLSDPADASLVTAICAMARGLGLAVIAEGVETREQADFLHRQGCQILQGYLFARPMPVQEFERFLRARACTQVET